MNGEKTNFNPMEIDAKGDRMIILDIRQLRQLNVEEINDLEKEWREKIAVLKKNLDDGKLLNPNQEYYKVIRKAWREKNIELQKAEGNLPRTK